MREPLPAEEVRKAIEHKSPSRVPMMIHQGLRHDVRPVPHLLRQRENAFPCRRAHTRVIFERPRRR